MKKIYLWIKNILKEMGKEELRLSLKKGYKNV